MKKISVLLSMVVFALALGAAFASSSKKMLVTEVWRKPVSGGTCAPTDCLIIGGDPCGATGYLHFNNASCIGTAVSPMKN